jgi:hypothetical protein
MYKFGNGHITDKDDIIMRDENTKVLIVTESYTTYLRVHTDWKLTNATEDDIRSLLTSTIPEEGHDQREELLTITDPFSDNETVKFDKEKL